MREGSGRDRGSSKMDRTDKNDNDVPQELSTIETESSGFQWMEVKIKDLPEPQMKLEKLGIRMSEQLRIEMQERAQHEQTDFQAAHDAKYSYEGEVSLFLQTAYAFLSFSTASQFCSTCAPFLYFPLVNILNPDVCAHALIYCMLLVQINHEVLLGARDEQVPLSDAGRHFQDEVSPDNFPVEMNPSQLTKEQKVCTEDCAHLPRF